MSSNFKPSLERLQFYAGSWYSEYSDVNGIYVNDGVVLPEIFFCDIAISAKMLPAILDITIHGLRTAPPPPPTGPMG